MASHRPRVFSVSAASDPREDYSEDREEDDNNVSDSKVERIDEHTEENTDENTKENTDEHTKENTEEHTKENTEEKARLKREKNKKKKERRKAKERAERKEIADDAENKEDSLILEDNKRYSTFATNLQKVLTKYKGETLQNKSWDIDNMDDLYWQYILPIPGEIPTIYEKNEKNEKAKDKKRKEFFDKYGLTGPILLCTSLLEGGHTMECENRSKNIISERFRSKATTRIQDMGNLMKLFGGESNKYGSNISEQTANKLFATSSSAIAERHGITPTEINHLILSTMSTFGRQNLLTFRPYRYFYVYYNIFYGDAKINHDYILVKSIRASSFLNMIQDMDPRKFDVLFDYKYDINDKQIFDGKQISTNINDKIAACMKIVKAYFFIENFSASSESIYIPDTIDKVFNLAINLYIAIHQYDVTCLQYFMRFVDKYSFLYELPEVIYYDDHKRDGMYYHVRAIYQDHKNSDNERTISIVKPSLHSSHDVIVPKNKDYIKACRKIEKIGNDARLIPTRKYNVDEYTEVPEHITKIASIKEGSFFNRCFKYVFQNREDYIKCYQIYDEDDITFFFIVVNHEVEEKRHNVWCVVEMKLIKSKNNEAYITPVLMRSRNCTFYNLQMFIHISHEIATEYTNDIQAKIRTQATLDDVIRESDQYAREQRSFGAYPTDK